MKQGGRPTASGFTIVETLIVMAVTGLLFASAAIAINGRQNKTQFATAINDVQQEFQQIINETASGYFPSNNTFTCTGRTSNYPIVQTAAGTGQGTNQGCIFLGKAIMIATGTANSSIGDFPITGNRLDPSGNQASTLYGATGTFPTAVAKGTSTNTGMSNALFQEIAQEYGLNEVSNSYQLPDGTTGTIGAFAILSSLGSYTGSNCTGLCSGSQSVGLYNINGTGGLPSLGAIVDKINNIAAKPIVPAKAMFLCFASGATNQSGLVTIGSAQNGLSVTVTVKSNKTCS